MRNGGFCWSGKSDKDDSPLSPVLLSQAAFDGLTDEVVTLRAENARLERLTEGLWMQITALELKAERRP